MRRLSKEYNKMRKPIESVFTIILLAATALAFGELSYADQFKCTRVSDGDTIKVTGSVNKITIRLVGIDAPETSRKKHEPGQPFSQKSSKYLSSLVLNKSVDVKSFSTDRYGRTLGVVFVDGKNVNLEMIKAGLAEVYRGKPAPGLDLEPYWNAEVEAKKANVGMWSLGNKYVSPKDWRRMQRK
jgi:endonuclease YncB( thermonuclease family)